MINRSVLVGRLTRDPELRYTGSGVAVASFTLAVNRPFSNSSGERESDFINCVMWRKSAENFSNFTRKGSLVGIDGRIQTRSYENQQGQRVYVTEVVADNFSLLETRAQAEQRQSQESNSQPNDSSNDINSSNKGMDSSPNMNPNDPFSGNSNDSIDISDDDLPF